MAHQEKSNKNIKKVATKAVKVAGAPKVPKYERGESGIVAFEHSAKDKKK